jgi:hypothetical protein
MSQAWVGLLVFGLSLMLPSGAQAQPSNAASDSSRIEYLVPAMRGRTLALQDGPRPYLRRLAFSPAFGQLGSEPYYLLRLAYNPSRWMAYEAVLGHNPAQSVHSLVHTLNAVVRWPFSGRVQPYLTVGYGMMLIFPGRVFSADPVTANQMSAGGGLEIFLREDVALRGEWKGHRITNGQNDRLSGGRDYRELSLGLAFYRDVGR